MISTKPASLFPSHTHALSDSFSLRYTIEKTTCDYVTLANGRTHNAKLIYVDKKLSLTQTTYVTQTKRARTATALLAVAVGRVDRSRPRYHVKSQITAE